MADSGHFGFMQITRVAQSCQFGNQAEFVQGPWGPQVIEFIVPTIARFKKFQLDYSGCVV